MNLLLIIKLSFFNNIKSNLVGKIIKKYIMAIIIGEINFPNKNPNFIQTIFNGVRIFDLFNPRTKNDIDKIINNNDKSKFSFEK